MEFSWNYEEVMRRMATDSLCGYQSTYRDAREQRAYSLMLKFTLNCKGCDVPTFALNRVENHIPANTDEELEFVVPMDIGAYDRQASGAETILKYFTRFNDGRLIKIRTPKGEVYYGNSGIVLDKNLNPLLLATTHVEYDERARYYTRTYYTIHLAPRVFTDDDKLLNKSLAKKGIAYYLTHNSSSWSNTGLPYKVVIDDCADFVIKAHRPDVNNCTNEEMNQVLKDNIDEVLRQIADDARRNF